MCIIYYPPPMTFEQHEHKNKNTNDVRKGLEVSSDARVVSHFIFSNYYVRHAGKVINNLHVILGR